MRCNKLYSLYNLLENCWALFLSITLELLSYNNCMYICLDRNKLKTKRRKLNYIFLLIHCFRKKCQHNVHYKKKCVQCWTTALYVGIKYVYLYYFSLHSCLHWSTYAEPTFCNYSNLSNNFYNVSYII